MKLAAIDIGSNAIRLQITNVLITKLGIKFKKVEYVRFPLRLGHDVFELGYISEARKEKFYSLMRAYKILIDLYEVDDYMGCATSAMRDSENGREIIKYVRDKIGLEIEIIDGKKEAQLINDAIFSYLDDKNYLHIDVGGGSTELNFYTKNKKLYSESFPIGSVRSSKKYDIQERRNEMDAWINAIKRKIKDKIIAVGTGGNINKLFELAGKTPGKLLSYRKIVEIRELISNTSMEDRINEMELNPDRADVILPAADIYLSVMKKASCVNILVPDVGLKDGIMQYLFARNT